ncbi:hypothetical protein [Kitasatospora sp. NPDC093806]|uniref:hypothetical protein n=1 Tax=Kitasatospora sp. NPDC093806 TaxID=3155075 RepID=UPI00343DA573
MCPPAALPAHGLAARLRTGGLSGLGGPGGLVGSRRAVEALARAGLTVLLLTLLGLIGHHSLPSPLTTTRHAATATAAPTPAVTHHRPAESDHRAAPVANHPAQACAEHPTCSSTVPARTVALAAPPPAALADGGPLRAGPASAVHPGGPWPTAPPPDLTVLSIART